jgi:uncharacterized repeat protein (TIGR03803 family)
MQAADGNLYGTTETSGGTGNYGGTVFKFTLGNILTTLYSFDTLANPNGGAVPLAGLAQGSGAAYNGTTAEGGGSSNCPYGCGTVFQITPAGTLSTLHSFDSADGNRPGGLVQGTDGNIYGATGGGGAYNGGTVFSLAVPATVTTLASSPNPSFPSQAVTFATAVTSSSGTPTGAVLLYNGSTQVGSGTLTNGATSVVVSGLPVGSDSITASYQGSSSFAPSTSAVLSQTVNPPASTTTALASTVNPVPVDQYVAYTASVTSTYGTATGTMTFRDNGVTVATAGMSNNQATFTTKYKAAGVQVITATYSGDSNNQASTSPAFIEDVGKLPYASKTTVATSGSPELYGQPVTFTATMTSADGSIPDGETVTFFAGSTEIGTGITNGGVATFTTSSLAAKTYTIKASYPGDSTFKKSSGTVKQVVTPYSTTTTLTSSLNPSNYGQPVTWTATVTSNGGPVPTGKVKFSGAGGSGTLNGSGVATLTKQWLNAATYAITAEYEGDDANASSDSAVLNQVVNPAATTTVVTSSPNPSSQGQSVTFTATVTTSTGVNSAGTVTFTAGGTTLGTATLSSNIASISTTALPVGTTVVQATYNGETAFTGSSGMVTQTVNP